MSPDRRWDDETRRRLEDIAAHYESFTAKISAIMWGLLAVVAVGGVAFTILLNQTSGLATKANTLATSIQASRADVCRSGNQRHMDTINALVAVYARSLHLPLSTTQHQLQVALGTGRGVRLPPGRSLRALRTSYTSTLLLVDALAPLRNCRTFIAE